MRTVLRQPTRHISLRRWRQAVVVVLAVLLLGSGTAYGAGSYNVEACTAAVGYANHSWSVTINNPTYLAAHEECGEGPADYETNTLSNLELGDAIGLSENVPVGTEGKWEVKAPAGTSIAEVTGYSSVYRQGPSWHVYRETENSKGEVDLESSCDGVETHVCALGGPFQATNLQARTMTIGALCTPEEYEPGKYFTTCPDGALVHDVRAGIAYATVTINDPNPPETILANNIPSGPQHGEINIAASATDPAAGLLSLTVVTKTGEPVGASRSPGACDYSRLTPCPTSTSNLSLPIDTEKLPNGQNELQVEATNAAHDHAYSTPFTVTVENPTTTSKEEPLNPEEVTTGNEQPQSSTNSGPTQANSDGSTSINGHTTTPSDAAGTTILPLLPVHIRARIAHHKLLMIEGTAPRQANGWISLQIDATLNDGRHFKPRRIRRQLKKGAFRASLSLPMLGRPAILRMTITYDGGRSFRRTVHHARFSLPGK